ncbi:hypothetical protein BDV95DRAFT_611915 [Massariosphaeria phaeospora]|uniref:F-box domain-containing protein n=1 Tax=Massariosphaeria phaeospora TaxID=100035 RepID=A0A7C8HZB7_9PLEO|nr:hypothetical protein BDV95DRAFT_611915 [Massariosphaeria phaeospora]
MATSVQLLGLPLTVFRLILDLLNRDDVDTIRLVSKACGEATEYVFFRKIALHDLSPSAEGINSRIWARLCDPQDALLHHVRHLQIGLFEQETHLPSEQTLVAVLGSLEHLQDFSWNARFPIPKGVLSALSTKWPAARLHVTNFDRREPKYLPLDTALLSSPQLYSLAYLVCGTIWNSQNELDELRSEFGQLRTCLLQTKRLKSLHLTAWPNMRLDENPHVDDSAWTTGPGNLDFREGDVFPALEELILPCDNYSLSRAHCQQWLAAMDWSHMRRLDFGNGCPREPMAALIGRVPQLKCFCFGFDPIFVQETVGVTEQESPSLYMIGEFLDGIEGLEEVIVNSVSSSWSMFNFTTISLCGKHGRTLKKLRLHYGVRSEIKGWSLEEVRGLVERCPGLEDLALRVTLDLTTPVPGCGMWSAPIVTEIQKLLPLRRLELETEVKYGRKVAQPSQFLNEADALKSAAALLRYLLNGKANTLVGEMIVKFVPTRPFFGPQDTEYIVARKAECATRFEVETMIHDQGFWRSPA